MCHLDCVGVAQLVGSKASAHTRLGGESSQLRTGGGSAPRSASRRSIDDAKERPDGHPSPVGDPVAQVLPAPVVHAYFAAFVALAVAHEQRSAAFVEV